MDPEGLPGRVEKTVMSTRLTVAFKYLGSCVFTLAGLFYIMAPPRTTSEFFDAQWPAMLWGCIFFAGGVVSGIGAVARVPHVERFGVFCVSVAAVCLTAGQLLVMLEYPITWTRGGGTLVYLGLASWAFERYLRLSNDVDAINALDGGERES